MEKCFYHSKTDAVTLCIGCKLPICQTCRDEGKRGYCDTCLKKVATLRESVADLQTTGVNQKTTLSRTARPGAKDVVFCSQHEEIVAIASCATCNRPYCGGCLNPQGLCSQCEAQGPVVPRSPEEVAASRPRRRRQATTVEAAPKKGLDPKQIGIAAAAALLVIVGAAIALHRPVSAPSEEAILLDKLHHNDLSPKEKAMLQALQQGAKNAHTIAEAPAAQTEPEAPPAAGPQTTGLRPNRAVRSGSVLHLGLIAPGYGATLRGVTTVRASVAGHPEHVELLVDGQSQGACNAAPYELQWATMNVSNGRHHLTMAAYDENGRIRASSSVTVNVRN